MSRHYSSEDCTGGGLVDEINKQSDEELIGLVESVVCSSLFGYQVSLIDISIFNNQ